MLTSDCGHDLQVDIEYMELEKDSEAAQNRVLQLANKIAEDSAKVEREKIKALTVKYAESREDLAKIVFGDLEEHLCAIAEFESFMSANVEYRRVRGLPVTKITERGIWEKLAIVLDVLVSHKLHAELEPTNGKIVEEFLSLDQKEKGTEILLQFSFLESGLFGKCAFAKYAVNFQYAPATRRSDCGIVR